MLSSIKRTIKGVSSVTRPAVSYVAKSSNYTAFKTNSKTGLEKIFRKIKNMNGPIMILIKITKGGKPGKRITHPPVTIKKRFSQNL